DLRYHVDYTGCGNTLNMRHPRTIQLLMDSLRYWVLEMHVDGFRFDLAAALARELHDVDRLSAFFDVVHQGPVIARVKRIAGAGGSGGESPRGGRGTGGGRATRSATSRWAGPNGTASPATRSAATGAATR